MSTPPSARVPTPRKELDIFANKVARFLDPHLVLAVLNKCVGKARPQPPLANPTSSRHPTPPPPSHP